MPTIHCAWAGAWALFMFLGATVFAPAAAPSPEDGFKAAIDSAYAICVQKDGGILAGSPGFTIDNIYLASFCRLKPDGSLDSSFTAKAKLDGFAFDIIADHDGKILVAGNVRPRGSTRNSPVARYNRDGSVDSSFQSELTTTNSTVYTYVALQADGKVVVTGNFGNTDRSVVRLNADGSIDTTFQAPLLGAEKGYIKPGFYAVAVLSDGRIVAAGYAVDSSGYNRIYMVRLNQDGSLDGSFTNGLDGKTGVIRKLIVQPDGRILVGGKGAAPGYYEYPFITRLALNGSIDPVFGFKSHDQVYPIYRDYYLEAQQPDGKILVGCKSYFYSEGETAYSLERWTLDGAVDPSYECPVAHLSDNCAAALQPDGKLVIGEDISYDTTRLSLTRFYPDGSVDEDFNVGMKVDNTIDQALFQPDGKLLVCGIFTNINGIARNRIARFNADGSLDSTFDPGAGSDAAVQRMALQPDGKILIGGPFDQCNGIERFQLARLNADGSLDQDFNPHFSYLIPIRAYPYAPSMNYRFAVRPDGKIMISGDFYAVDGVARKGMARLNADGSLDPTFEPSAELRSAGEFVLLPDGKVYVCGYFRLDGTNDPITKFLVRLNVNGSMDNEFEADTRINPVRCMTIQPDGKLLTVSGSAPSTGYTISRLNTDGTSDSTFARRTVAVFQSMTVRPDGRILVAGNLEAPHSASDYPLNQLKCLNADGTDDTGFSGGEVADENIWQTLALDDGKILVCGAFTQYLDEKRSRITVLNADGSVDARSLFPMPQVNGEVDALATREDGNILIGGAFETVYGMPSGGAARLSVDCDLDTSFSAQAGRVGVMAALPDGKTYLCDRVTSGPEVTVTRRNIDGTTDTSFRPVVADDGVACMIVQPDGGVLIGGNFHKVCGITRNQVARLDAIGSVTLTFNAGHGFDAGEPHYIQHGDEDSTDLPDELIIEYRGRVNSMALQSGRIIVGGLFDRVALADRGNIARLYLNGALDRSFDPGNGTDGEVFAVVVQPDGKVLIAGEFTRVDGRMRHGIARLNADGSVDEGFVPACDEFNYFHTLALQADGKIVMGGFYSSNAGYGRIARLNADGSLDTLFEAPDSMVFDFGGVQAIALQDDGKVLAGGLFGNIGAAMRCNLARISNPDAALQTLSVAPGGSSVTWQLGGAYPQPYQVLFEDSSDGVAWNELGWGTPVPGVGFTMTHPSLPTGQVHYVRATGWATGGLNNGSISLHRSTLYFLTGFYNASPDWACYE
ncbi:MAG: hypothetical protein ABFD69_10025 [Candidatus Sumerlaeia bacterium]